MTESSARRNERLKSILLLVTLAASFVLANVAVIIALQSQGYAATDDFSWQAAERARRLGALFPPDTARSLLPILLMGGWQRLFGADAIAVLLFKFVSLLFALTLFYRALALLELSFWSRIMALALTVASPYLVWENYVGREVALDVLGVALLMFAVARCWKGKGLRDGALVGIAGALATAMREPNLIVSGGLILYLVVLRRLSLRAAAIALLFFAFALMPILVQSYRVLGTPFPVTRSGVNLLYGNHPDYLAGHPTFDIDRFMRDRIGTETGLQEADLSPVVRDKLYREEAITYIRDDPVAFVYRGLLKAYWWLGLNRIPASDRAAGLDAESERIVLGPPTNWMKELVYVLHRSVVLIGALFFWKWPVFSWKKTALLLLPTIVVLPVVILSFPDTRFRIAFDPYFYAVSAAGLIEAGRNLRRRFLAGA